ncbi:MAG TPA: translation initiation factor IF-2 subunit alpha [Candidatus Thermoplasmatota archaeon]|jgi:translation initiation factor 2 subunit 1|nr:translation initiation factor IF-2 subunit alpha [Candidatus Thermoplasmatota archaeon]
MVKKNEYPEDGELVVGTVTDAKGYGAFVKLEEYPGKVGFIHIAELATGWVKYVRDHVRENQKVVCKVTGVDKSKGHVDLSLKRVNEHQRREKIAEWKNEQKAEKLFEMLAKELGKDLKEFYEEAGFRLQEKYGSLYAAFEMGAMDPDQLKQDGFAGPWMKRFLEIAAANVTIPFVTIKGELEVTSNAPNGFEHVQEALLQAEKSEFEDVDVSVQYLGAPRYLLKVKAPDYKIAEEQLKKAVDRVDKVIHKHGGQSVFHREAEKAKAPKAS